MSLPMRRPANRRRSQSIQAAARLMPSDDGRFRPEEPGARGGFGWQTRAWHVYRHLGSIHYAMSFIRDNVSLLEFYVARVPEDPEETPEVLDRDNPAAEELERLGNGPYGSVPALFAELVVHDKVAGEGWLSVRYERDGESADVTRVPDEDLFTYDEVWEVLTAQTRYRRKNDPKLRAKQDVRVWRPDPERPEWPDSSLRAVLAECEQLLLIQQMTTGTLQSRLHNGILAYPEELDPTPPGPPDDGDDEMSPLMRDMFKVFSAPIADPGSAAAIMPYLLGGKGDLIDKIKHLSLSRDFDAMILEIKEDLVRTVAAGIDLPAERLIGMADANHWCADFETEVLTINGWRSQSDIAIGDIILTLNHETGLSEWQPIEHIYRADVIDEPMVSIETGNHSSLTTQGHRWPVIQNGGGKKWVTSDELSGYHHIIAGAPHADIPTEAKYSDALVELVAWAWTDSSLRKGGGFLALNQSHSRNPQRCDRIRMALTAEFGPGVDSFRPLSDYPRWREYRQTEGEQSGFGGPQTMFFLNKPASDVLAEHVTKRRVDLSFIRSLTRSQLELFIDVSCKADGRHYRQGRLDIWQKNRSDLDAFEYACLLSGRAARLRREPDPDGWEVSPRTSSTARPVKAAYESERTGRGSASMETVPYTGIVWCPTTSNGTWMARRNGHSYFTGNSAWLLDDITYSQHLAPAVDLVVDGIVTSWLRPAWKALNLDPFDYTVIVDATRLTSRVRKGDDAIKAYRLGELNGKALRRELGFDGSDAPTDDDPGLRGQPMLGDGDVPSDRGNEERGIPVTAASFGGLDGATLSGIDADVLAELFELANAEAERQATDAEARLVEAMAVAGLTTDTPDLSQALVDANIGPEQVVPDDAFDGISDDAERILSEGLADAAATVAVMGGIDIEPDSSMAANVAAAVAGLSTALVSWLRSRWFSPTPGADTNAARLARGEQTFAEVPPGLLLDTMTLAGGGVGATPGSIGVANGATVEGWLAQAGLSTVAWKWVYGTFPRETFRPHKRLDGTVFDDFESDALYNESNRWPHNSYWAPGDHDFCSCVASRVLALTEQVLT